MFQPHPKILQYAQRFGLFEGLPTQKTFFTSYGTAQDAFDNLPLMHDIIPACRRLMDAYDDGERICIYCDYDTDAVTAGATMYWGLRILGFNPDLLTFYTPDRFTEGYGINKDAFDCLARVNDLIVSVDCGINSVEEVDTAQTHNCDVIITDHHQLSGDIPKVLAVVNPQLHRHQEKLKEHNALNSEIRKHIFEESEQIAGNDNFASYAITGVGVAWFVLVWLSYLMRQKHYDVEPVRLNSLLPFVAIGTIADCQSILDQTNRQLVKGGLILIGKRKYCAPGLKALMQQTGYDQKIADGYPINSSDLGFVFSPILNASGRMTHASHSLALMTMDDTRTPISQISSQDYSHFSIDGLAKELIQVNEDRKQMIRDIINDIDEEVDNQQLKDEPVISLMGPWSKGVIGLIASRIVSKVDKPVLVFTTQDSQKYSGSMRAPQGYDLSQAIHQSKDLLIAGGGHPGAAGGPILPENISKFLDAFRVSILNQQVIVNQEKRNLDQLIKSDIFSSIPDVINSINPDSTIVVEQDEDIAEIARSIQLLEPFGQHFPQPKLLVRGVLAGARIIGKNANHFKAYLGSIPVTQFYASNELLKIIEDQQGQGIEMVLLLKPSYNTWNGVTKLECIIEKCWVEDVALSVVV